MLIFPQLSTGASAQYPIERTRLTRTIVNVSEDGRRISLSDANAKQVRWDLAFEELTDQECANLSSFYALCEGSLQPFLFCDPTRNLLAYSEDYTQTAWIYNSELALTTGIDDPFGTNRASRFTNNSGANLTLTQTAGISGTVECCFSVYLRSRAPTAEQEIVQLMRTDGSTIASVPVQVTGGWARFALSTVLRSSTSTTCDFSLTVPAGTALDVFGMQVDAQPNAGKYVTATSETGVFPDARFDANALTVISTGPGQSTVHTVILSRASE